MRPWLLGLDRSLAVRMGAVVTGYLALAAWSHELAGPAPVPLWHAPPGLAVAAVALGGAWMAAPVLVAELVASVVVVDVAGDIGAVRTVVDACLVTGAIALVGLVIRRTRIDPEQHRIRDVAALTLVLIAGAMATAAAGITAPRSAGLLPGAWSDAVRTWFEADVLGLLTVSPAVLLAVSRRERDRDLVPRPRLVSWGGGVEAVLVVGVPVATVALLDRIDLLYLSLVPVALVAMRRSQPGAAVAAAATVGTLATALAVTGDDLARSALIALYGAVALTGSVTGFVATRRYRTIHRDHRLGAALDRSDDLVVLATLEGEPRWWNRAAGRVLLRWNDGTPALLSDVLVGGADRVARLARHVAAGDVWEADETLVGPDGRELPVSLMAVPDVDDHRGVVGYALIARDDSVRRAREAALARGALYDELTGVANRALLTERLAQACERLRRTDNQSALLLLDIDRFAVVNDGLGRAAGDELLRAMTARFGERLRAGDTLARLGGDEFTVLVEGIDGQRPILAVAEEVLTCLREPFVLSVGSVVVAASLGIVRLDADDDPEDLIRRADLAMYRAKAEGGARYTVYDDRLTVTANRRLRLESALRRSLANPSAPLHYQPVVDLTTGSTVFLEALLRAEFTGLGAIGPPEVLTVAREAGLLDELGRQVVRTAAQAAHAWPAGLAVSVNVTATELANDHLATVVDRILHECRLDAGRLILEVTEEAFLDDPTRTATTLSRCRELGVRVALDDFGAGWSSLAALRTLPIDILKLDPLLLSGLADSPAARATVGAVLGVAEVLEVEVVAEGIDSDEQLEVARSLGCQLGQGHRVARPATGEQLDPWLRAPRAVDGLTPPATPAP